MQCPHRRIPCHSGRSQLFRDSRKTFHIESQNKKRGFSGSFLILIKVELLTSKPMCIHYAFISMIPQAPNKKKLKKKKKDRKGHSLEVQWLGFQAFTVEGSGLIPGQGTKIPLKRKKPCSPPGYGCFPPLTAPHPSVPALCPPLLITHSLICSLLSFQAPILSHRGHPTACPLESGLQLCPSIPSSCLQ